MYISPVQRQFLNREGALIETKFPIALSSSLIGAYKACPMKFFWEYILNRVPIGESEHLVAGAAYAVGHEVFRKLYYTGATKEQAMHAALVALTKEYGEMVPHNSYKSWDRVAQSLVSYYENYAPDTDLIRPAIINNEPSVEFSFTLPLPIAHPDTGEPLLYAGRFDSIMQMGQGLYVYDDKTTKQMGPTWADQWDMRQQFTGYTWGARQYGIPIEGIIVRGCAIQKTQIKFNQVILSRPQWTIDRWYEDLLHIIGKMVQDYQDGYWSYNLDAACNMYGGCSYKTLCEVQNPETWVPVDFMDRTWEPVLVETL